MIDANVRIRHVPAGVLDVAYYDLGPAGGDPVVLLHGFPYDVHSYAEVAPLLVEAGFRVLVPYLRGHGPTRFLSADTPRSGQQGALGADLLVFLDALGLHEPILAGYDWGGRAAGVVAALHPDRIGGLVSAGGFSFRTSPPRTPPSIRTAKPASGTSGTSRPPAAGRVWSATGARSPA